MAEYADEWELAQECLDTLDKLETLGRMLRTLRATTQAAAVIAADLYEKGAVTPEGESLLEWAVGQGYTTTEIRGLIRLGRKYHKLVEMGVCPEKILEIPPALIPALTSPKIPDEKRKELIEMATIAPPAAVMEEVEKLKPRKRAAVFRVFKGPFREVEAESCEEVEAGPDEVVVKGGVVVKGALMGEV